MADKDNLVGAPASGFGQTVSFAFQPNGRRVQATEPARRVGPRGGTSGGGVGRLPDAPGVATPPRDPTVDVLMKMGQEILAPKLKQAKQAKFVEGMSKAAAGQAVAEIAAEQPWYAEVFGDTDVIEGARAYHSQAGVARTIAGMEEAMPELRRMAPAQAQAEVNRRLTESLTGDDSVDAHILGATAKLLPGVLKRHAKEHYAYLQEEASAAESEARRADADMLQASASGLADGTIGAMEYDLRYQQVASRARPAAGRNLESYAKQLAADMQLMARKGQLHALNAYRSGGYLDALPADLARQVEVAIDTAENTQRAAYSFEWADDLAALKLRTIDPQDWSPRRYFDEAKGLNTRYKALTGSTRDLIPLPETVTDMEQMARVMYQAERQAAEEARKRIDGLREKGLEAEAAALEQSKLDEFLAVGAVARAKASLKSSDDAINLRHEQLYREKGPIVLAQAFQNSNGFVNPLVKAQLTAGVRAALGAGDYTAAARTSYQAWRQLREVDASGALAAAYFGDGDMDKRMEVFHVLSQGGAEEHAIPAYRQAFTQPLKMSQPDGLDKKQRAELVKTVVGEHYGGLIFKGDSALRDDATEQVTRVIQREYELWMGAVPGMDSKRAAKLALASAQARGGLNIAGGYTWQDARGERKLQDIVQEQMGDVKLPDNPADQARLWKGALDAELGDLKDSQLSMYRLPDGGLGVTATKDGKPHIRYIPAANLAARMKTQIADALKPTTMGIKQEDLRFGPTITYQPAPGARSIYGR